MRKLLLIIPSVLIALLLLGGCSDAGEVNYTEQKDIARLEERLCAVLSRMTPDGYTVEVNPEGETNDERYVFLNGSEGAALVDIDLDGIPEVAEVFGGGSSGNSYWVIYDIESGEKLGELDCGNGSYSTYICRESGEYRLFERCALRFGAEGRGRYLREAVFDSETSFYTAVERLGAVYEITLIYDDDGEFSPVGEEYGNIIYRVDGAEATIDEYFAACDSFYERYALIPETEVRVFSWREMCENDDTVARKSEKMAKALLTSEQRFVG